MDKDLQDIINQSSFKVIGDDFRYLKAITVPIEGDHFLVSKDADELTIVTTEDQKKFVDIIEQNKEIYCLIALKVSIPFYCVGFLAVISSEIAKKGMNILIVSTYSKDYILVKVEDKKMALDALRSLGFQS
jgi:hypothetical protein